MENDNAHFGHALPFIIRKMDFDNRALPQRKQRMKLNRMKGKEKGASLEC